MIVGINVAWTESDLFSMSRERSDGSHATGTDYFEHVVYVEVVLQWDTCDIGLGPTLCHPMVTQNHNIQLRNRQIPIMGSLVSMQRFVILESARTKGQSGGYVRLSQCPRSGRRAHPRTT